MLKTRLTIPRRGNVPVEVAADFLFLSLLTTVGNSPESTYPVIQITVKNKY
jgi:hypothetical protein